MKLDIVCSSYFRFFMGKERIASEEVFLLINKLGLKVYRYKQVYIYDRKCLVAHSCIPHIIKVGVTYKRA